MSKSSIVDFTCPNCNNTFKIKRWDSYNPSVLLSPKSKIVSGDIFKYRCPKCKTEHTVIYQCLYHDMKNNTMVLLMPDYHEKQYLFSAQEAKLFSVLPNYKLRLENSYNSFLERIRIIDLNVNDKLFEVYRIIALQQISYSIPNADELYFVSADKNEYSFQVLGKGKHIKYAKLNVESFLSLEAQCSNLSQLEEKYAFEKIDADWVVRSGLLDAVCKKVCM